MNAIVTDDGSSASGADLALVVNVSSQWGEVRRGHATAEAIALGDWNLAARNIDPARVAVVYASYRKSVVAAFDVDGFDEVLGYPDARFGEKAEPHEYTSYGEPRIRFTAGRRHRHLEGAESPYIWRRGELYPVVAMSIDELPENLAVRPADQQTELAGYTLVVHPDGNATVLAPIDRTVSVRSRRNDAVKTSATVDLSALLELDSGIKPILLD